MSEHSPLTIEKCACDHPACNDYFISITRSDGRVTKDEAEFMMLAWNNHDKLVGALAELTAAVIDLIESSDGVAGLHLNGDLAPWNELTEGGRFDSWLCSLAEAERTLAALKEDAK